MNIIWDAPRAVKKGLKFADLDLNSTFKLVSGEAVYVKVEEGHRNGSFNRKNQFMLELVSGRLFQPSSSDVELVEVTVNVGVSKPQIY